MASAIGSVGDLVRVIQAQLSQPAARAPARPERVRKAASPAGPAGKLASLIELRISQLEPGDPQRGRKAFRLFLESVLLAQFGDHLLNDPKFYLLVDDVQEAMERDDKMGHMIKRAIDRLLAKS